MNIPYRIFASEDWDWFVVAKYCGQDDEPDVMYQGHSLDQAYKTILEDLDILPEIVERDMVDLGTYEPTIEDFFDESKE